MERNFDLKRRDSEDFTPEKLRGILSKIYAEDTVDELMDRLAKESDGE